jgi:inosine/xanthosine triphosphatase
MRIVIGSLSDQKKAIVSNVLGKMSFKGSIDVFKGDSYIQDQPMSIGETTLGAMNRAYQAYMHTSDGGHCVGLGLEGGMSYTDESTLDMICIAAFYDGSNFYIGKSDLLRLPEQVAIGVNAGGEYGVLIREHTEANPSAENNELVSREQSFTLAISFAYSEWKNSNNPDAG